MPSDTKNVKLGVCNVNYGGVDLGYTKGGVDVEVKTTTKEVEVDQFGNSPINEYILSRTVTAKVPLAETTLENLVRIMPGASLHNVGGTKGTATATFSTAAPVDGDKVALNGVAIAFKTVPVAGTNDIALAGVTTPALAAQALAAVINSSDDPALSAFTASVNTAAVTITADDAGAWANSIPLVATFTTGANITIVGFSGGADANKKKVVVPNAVGLSLLAIAKKLVLHPQALDPADKSEDFIIPLAATAGDLSYSYKLDQERVFPATFKGYPDSNTKVLFIAGDEAAA